MLNRTILMGRLTHDPELRQTSNGTAVVSFSVAVERDYKDSASGNRATDFIDVVAWRQTAEFVRNYFSKGQMIAVEGRLQVREWQDDDGHKRRNVAVVADQVYFAGGKPEHGNRSSTPTDLPTGE